MSAENLVEQGYYDNYGEFSWTLQDMKAVLERMEEVPSQAMDTARSKQAVKFLVLGSATPRNLDNMALLDRQLRPGMGDQDSVTVIDYNMQPLTRHQERKKYLDQCEASDYQNRRIGNIPLLLYPDFTFAQADMKSLPLADASVDVVVTDYTFNFLPELDEVDAAFSETARVMADGGMLLMSVAGNSDHPGWYLSDDVLGDVRHDKMSGGFDFHLFPLDTYRHYAEEHGLILEACYHGESEMRVGIFQKTGDQAVDE